MTDSTHSWRTEKHHGHDRTLTQKTDGCTGAIKTLNLNVKEHPDDIAIWPDGTWAYIGDVRKGDYHYMSDDYEVVPIEDIARLSELGLADEPFL